MLVRVLSVGFALVFVVVACTTDGDDGSEATCSAKACVCEASECLLDCGEDDKCAPQCTGFTTSCDTTCGTHCDVTCQSGPTCNATVGDASVVSCAGVQTCNVTCTGSCRVHCTSAAACNAACPNGAAPTKCDDGWTCGEAC